MNKEIKYGQEARKLVRVGLDKLADAVKETLGPQGQFVILEQRFGPPIITNDGVTIAKRIQFENAYENIGATLVREASVRTNDVAGDGTTTVCVLAQAMVRIGNEIMKEDSNPFFVRKGIEKAVEAIVGTLKKMAVHIDFEKKEDALKTLTNIAAVSCGDRDIGELVAKAIMSAGKHGIIVAEPAMTHETTLESVEGMQFQKGLISPMFITDAQRMECVLEDPLLIITDNILASLPQVMPILNRAAETNRPFVVIAPEIEGEVLPLMIHNKMTSRLKCAAIQAPGFGEERENALSDIAVLTGGTLISTKYGHRLEDATVAMLGSCRRIVIGKDKTTIIGGAGKAGATKARIEEVGALLKKTKPGPEHDILKNRLAQIGGGFGVIKVGAATDSEMKAKKFKVEDAIHASMAALEEGILPGGGIALLRATELVSIAGLNPNERIGSLLVLRAMREPFKTIVANSGLAPDEALKMVSENENHNWGLDALTLEYTDLMEAGITDPLKVVRCALENAASIAKLLLTTNVVVTNVRFENYDKEPNPFMPA